MGTCASAPVTPNARNWKIIKTFDEEASVFQQDPSLPAYVEDDQVVWRKLLVEPAIHELISSTLSQGGLVYKNGYVCDDYLNMLACWTDIYVYQQQTANCVRRSKAAKIYQSYVQSVAKRSLPISTELRAHLRAVLQEVEEEGLCEEHGHTEDERMDIYVFSQVSTLTLRLTLLRCITNILYIECVLVAGIYFQYIIRGHLQEIEERAQF
jgi:hypothetical protein